MLRFTLFGFPVAIHWMFWLTMALLGNGFGANSPEQFRRLVIWIIAALISIIIHELGHAFIMRGYGARASIMLYGLGGLAIPDRGFTRGQNIVVSLAGPVVEVAFGLLAYFFLKSQVQAEGFGDVSDIMLQKGVPYTFIFLWKFAFISVLWGIINLVPIYPLDGGQVLFNLLGPTLIKVTYGIGIVCGVAVALWMYSQGSIFSTILFGMLAFENLQRIRGATPNSILRPM